MIVLVWPSLVCPDNKLLAVSIGFVDPTWYNNDPGRGSVMKLPTRGGQIIGQAIRTLSVINSLSSKKKTNLYNRQILWIDF